MIQNRPMAKVTLSQSDQASQRLEELARLLSTNRSRAVEMAVAHALVTVKAGRPLQFVADTEGK